jgi:glycosyltransferase involved in cell wall biosynthesis
MHCQTNKKRILFLTDNFFPEVNAPATRTFEHCRRWVNQGCNVTVITGFPNFPQGKVYPGYSNKLYQVEEIEGIRVIRVWTYITPNEGLAKRILDYISYSISSFIAGLFQKCDVIVATTPQFFTALSGRTLSLIKRKPWIMEVRDVWPESIKTVELMNDNLFFRYFEWQEKRCYKSARKIVVVTEGIKQNLIDKSVPPQKIFFIPNGVDLNAYSQIRKNHELQNKLGLVGKTIVGYLGTHGMAHKLDFILSCARHIANPGIHFLFIGSGAEKSRLVALCSELELDNVTMLEPVTKNEVPEYISIMDISLVNLKKSDLFKGALPSKMFENAAMGKPLLLGIDGEARTYIEKYSAGLYFEPENRDDFLHKLSLLASDKELYDQCTRGAIEFARAFDREKLADSMLKLLF